MNPQITGGANKYPVFDRHGRPIRQGNKLRAKVCAGRYGQTRIIETTVDELHYEYCSICTKDGVIGFNFNFSKNVLEAKHVHHDFEHGHETWAEVIV